MKKRSSLFIPFIIHKLYILAVPMTLYDDGALKRGVYFKLSKDTCMSFNPKALHKYF